MDYNGDGTLDLVSGQYGGFVYLALGTGKGQLLPPARLKDKTGAEIHMGKYWDDAKSQWAEEKKTFKDLGLYHLTVDWDADGDLDLVTGGFEGKLGLRLNEGTRKRPLFSTSCVPVKAGDTELKVKSGLSPAFVDWDGDGLRDLIVADSVGTIRCFKNAGSKTAPKFKEAIVLLKNPNLAYVMVAVGDLNGDGALDLVYGAEGTDTKHPLWVMYRKKAASE